MKLLLTTVMRMVMKTFTSIIKQLIMIAIKMAIMLLMIMIRMEMRMMMTVTVAEIMVLAGFLSGLHVFTLAQMERDRRRGRTPAARGTLAPQRATTRARTPATAGRRRHR